MFDRHECCVIAGRAFSGAIFRRIKTEMFYRVDIVYGVEFVYRVDRVMRCLIDIEYLFDDIASIDVLIIEMDSLYGVVVGDIANFGSINFVYEISEAIYSSAVALNNVAGDDKFGIITDASEHHEHLIRGRVLHFVGNNEGSFECASSHIGEW